MKPISRSAAKSAGLLRYFTGTPCPKGHVCERYVGSYGCTDCARLASVARTRILRATDDKYREERRAYLAGRRADPEYVKKLREDERQKYATDPEFKRERLEKARRYRSENLAVIVARNAERHAAKLRRTPSWAERSAIRKFYLDCPAGFHVDHIIPLQGKTVSGLHVLANLQYLPAAENIRKGNRFAA
jgi:hypothetical protein